MPAPILSRDQLDAVYRRAIAGESLYALSREHSVTLGALSKRLASKYGFVADQLKRATVHLPDDLGKVAYIAGLIDGEGTIVRDRRGTGHLVQVRITNRAVIDWLAQWGGSAHYDEVRDATRKPTHVWHVTSHRDVSALLRGLLPYLRVKRPQAEAALAFAEARIARGSPNRGRKGWGFGDPKRKLRAAP